MENLSSKDMMELVTFYKQKATDTEFGLLQTQLKVNQSVPIIEELRNIVKIHEATIKTLQEEKQFLEAQVADLLNPKPKPRKPRS
jgi:cell division protein FtsB